MPGAGYHQRKQLCCYILVVAGIFMERDRGHGCPMDYNAQSSV